MNELTTTTNNAAAMMYSKIADPLQYCSEMGKSLAVTFALNSPHHGTIMALTCMTEGISPPVYHARYHADGSMRASSIQAEFERRNNPIDWLNLGDDGKVAHTTVRVNERYRAHTCIQAELHTGRTHQIRVHLAHAGYPLVGDATYGARGRLPMQPTLSLPPPGIPTHLPCA